MNTQTQEALKMAGFELDGVIADIKLSGEFDCVSYDTIVRVRKTIADYVAPSWQALSDDEIEYWECLKAPPVHPDFIDDDSWREFARCIEAALKEKNDKG